MVKDGADLTQIIKDELEKFRLNFSRWASRDAALLTFVRYL